MKANPVNKMKGNVEGLIGGTKLRREMSLACELPREVRDVCSAGTLIPAKRSREAAVRSA